MTLFTTYQQAKLLENGNPDNRDKDHAPVVKLFLPGTVCTWLLSELDPEEPNIAFGLCDLGMGFPEMGLVDLEEIQAVRHPIFDLPVELDTFFKGKYPLTVYADAAREVSRITESEELLSKHYQIRLKKNSPKP